MRKARFAISRAETCGGEGAAQLLALFGRGRAIGHVKLCIRCRQSPSRQQERGHWRRSMIAFS